MIPPHIQAKLDEDINEVLQGFRKLDKLEGEALRSEAYTQKDLEFISQFLAFLKQLNLYLAHFPRFERYGLTSRIRNSAYEVYTLLIEIKKKYYKKTSLAQLDVAFETLKMQIYLSYELGYFDYQNEAKTSDSTKALKRYGVLQMLLAKLGRQIGGLLRAKGDS